MWLWVRGGSGTAGGTSPHSQARHHGRLPEAEELPERPPEERRDGGGAGGEHPDEGLLLPRDRNKTLTALAGAEPVVGAQHPAVQGLQFFLAESAWDAQAVNARRLELLRGDPATAPHAGGVLVLDDMGDREAGTHTAHVGRQDLGPVGKLDNGIVAVTSLWADERVSSPLLVEPYTPARRLPRGLADPAFRVTQNLSDAIKPSSRGISRSRASWAGPTSRCAVTAPSGGTGTWSAAPSPSAGGPGSPPGRPSGPRHQKRSTCPRRRPPPRVLRRPPRRGRGGKRGARPPGAGPARALRRGDLAGGPAPRARLAAALDHALAVLAPVVLSPAAPRARSTPHPRQRRLCAAPVSPALTTYR